MILICAATGFEFSLVKEALGKAKEFYFLKTGVGFNNAKKSLEQYLKENKKPTRVYSTGFAGSLSQNISPGEWVSASSVLINGKNILVTPGPFPNLKPVRLLSTDQLQTAYESNECEAVDMESGALAEVCASTETPFSVVRYITDSSDQPLPEFLSHVTEFMKQDEISLKALALLNSIRAGLRKPRDVLEVMRKSKKWRKEFIKGLRAILKQS